MIAFLKGKIRNKGKNFLVVEVNAVGYKVIVNPVAFTAYEINSEAEFYIHHHIREDMSDLYGFRNLEELEFFELLLSVSGVGPKSAIGVLSVADISEIKSSIAGGDPALLTKVSGIGKKTAERVVLELREKIAYIDDRRQTTDDRTNSGVSDEIDALMALGYSLQQAREALKKVDASVKDSGERIREALKGMN